LIGGLTAGLAILIVLLAWRLTVGPISLAFLSPYIERVLTTDPTSFSIGLDDTILTWAGWERTLDIRVLNVRAVDPDGKVIASVPELSLSLSARAMMGGLVAPKSIDLFGPSLLLVRHEDGRFEVGSRQGAQRSDRLLTLVFDALQSGPDPRNALSYLTRVVIVDADVTFEDRSLGTTWRSPSNRMSLFRTLTGIEGDLSFDLSVADQQTHVTVGGTYLAADRKLDFGMEFGAMDLSVLSHLSPHLAPLAALDIPVRGTITAAMDIDGTVDKIGFVLNGDAGRIRLPAPFAQQLPIESLAVSGNYDGPLGSLVVDELRAELGERGRLVLPASDGHAIPLKTVRARGRFLAREKRLVVGALEADLQGPKVSLGATIDGDGGNLTGKVKGSLNDVPIDEVRRYWPQAWGTDAHQWITANLSDGWLRQVTAGLSFKATGKDSFDLVALDGDMILEGVTVDYLAPMPKVRNVASTVTFDRKRLEMKVSGGRSGNLKVPEGKVVFTGLDAYDQYADVTLAIEGPMRDAIELIEHEPLGFASTIGLAADKTSGVASTGLKLRFIVEHALSADRIKVSATSRLDDVAIADIFGGMDIVQGKLGVEVDNQAMTVRGRADLGAIPVLLAWRRNFGDTPAFQSRYQIKGLIEQDQWAKSLGFDFAPFTGDTIRGPTEAEVTVTEFDDKRREVRAKLDLTETHLLLADLKWIKPQGVPGTAQVDLTMQGDQVRAIDRFTIEAGDLKVLGSAQLAPDGKGVRRLVFDRFAYDRNDLSGVVMPLSNGGWDANFKGASFDLSPTLNDLRVGSSLEGDFAERPDIGPDIVVSMNIDRVWLGEERYLKQVAGIVSRHGDKWTNIDLQGRLEGNKLFKLMVKPADGRTRAVTISAEDAGAALRAFDLYESMMGGTLKLNGTFDDSKPSSPLTARLTINGYRVVDAPALAQLISIMALTGILESLQGDGLSFTTLDAPFVFEGGVLEVSEARATGVSLGFTASGNIYTAADVVNLEGTVVPAYAINSLLGHIPLLGELFTGGEKGGGVFAANYRMHGPTEDPKIEVNPLSALAPGFLRELFGIFEGVETKPATNEDTQQDSQ
jgi:hypothetical protein